MCALIYHMHQDIVRKHLHNDVCDIVITACDFLTVRDIEISRVATHYIRGYK